MRIHRITDPEFIRYGKQLAIPSAEIIAAAKTLEMPITGTRYEPSIDVLEQADITPVLRNDYYGELPIQVGCCWGHNDQLNALEWHNSSEINIAATDLILMLGHTDEMRDRHFDSANIKAFLLKKGDVIEVYASTLHFCPCTENEEGFRCIVVLPKGTNLPLEGTPTNPLLFRKNKWLICHIDNAVLKGRGAYPGLSGENLSVVKTI
jgi:hypothetical protein